MVQVYVSALALMAAAVVPAMVDSFALSPSMMSARRGGATMAADKQRVLIIGGTRFSGLYLTKELHSRGHEVWLLREGVRINPPLAVFSLCVQEERAICRGMLCYRTYALRTSVGTHLLSSAVCSAATQGAVELRMFYDPQSSTLS